MAANFFAAVAESQWLKADSLRIQQTWNEEFLDRDLARDVALVMRVAHEGLDNLAVCFESVLIGIGAVDRLLLLLDENRIEIGIALGIVLEHLVGGFLRIDERIVE